MERAKKKCGGEKKSKGRTIGMLFGETTNAQFKMSEGITQLLGPALEDPWFSVEAPDGDCLETCELREFFPYLFAYSGGGSDGERGEVGESLEDGEVGEKVDVVGGVVTVVDPGEGAEVCTVAEGFAATWYKGGFECSDHSWDIVIVRTRCMRGKGVPVSRTWRTYFVYAGFWRRMVEGCAMVLLWFYGLDESCEPPIERLTYDFLDPRVQGAV